MNQILVSFDSDVATIPLDAEVSAILREMAAQRHAQPEPAKQLAEWIVTQMNREMRQFTAGREMAKDPIDTGDIQG